MHLSLLKTRPFNKFVEMELERDNLYKSFRTLDEPKEISTSWITFAESCSQNLSVIINLADMAIQRIYDVYIDTSQEKDNPLVLHELLYGDFKNQIAALNQFELQLGILTYVYSQVRNRGVFNHAPKTTQYEYYIAAKESIDTILYRILNNEIPTVEKEDLTPSPSVPDMLQVLMPLVHLENLKRLIPVYDSLPDYENDPKVLSKKGEYDYLQGITLVTHIIDIARKASRDFWWADPISELSILNHAKEHFESVISLWNKIPETLGNRALAIQSEFLPIVEAHSAISLVQHFKLLAQNAMESGDQNHAAIYFREAKKEFDKACNLLENSDNPESNQILKKIQKEESELEILLSLTDLALKYTEIVNYLYAQDTENASKSCLEIEKLLKKIERAGSLPYVYGVSVIYSSAALILNELVGQEIDNLAVIDRLVSQFQFPLKAMSAALSDVNLESIDIDDSNPIKSYQELQELDGRLSYLEKAIELLPPFLSDIDLKRHRIHAMKYYIKSIIAENKTYIYADNNIVLDLILRARAHYYAKKAEQSIEEIKSKKQEKNLRQLISDRLLKTKTLGMVTESSLVSLGLQSIYKNEVRGYIEEMIRLMVEVEELPEIISEVAEKRFDEMIDFQEMLDLIMIDTQELLVANVEVSIKGNEINWDFVKRREAFIPAVRSMFEVVKLVILGELNIMTKKKAKAESSYLKAGEILYNISSSLGNIAQYLEEQQDLPQTIYTISLFCRENAQAIRDRRKTKEVPYTEIISILDYLILNL